MFYCCRQTRDEIRDLSKSVNTKFEIVLNKRSDKRMEAPNNRSKKRVKNVNGITDSVDDNDNKNEPGIKIVRNSRRKMK